MTQTKHIDFGRGLYGMAELARYVAFQADDEPVMSRVPYWVNHALVPPEHRRRRPDYGFLELISLFIVRDLVRSGLRLKQIRTAEAYLQKQLKHARPFATESIYTDGGNIFYEAAPAIDLQITAADLEGQEALLPALRLSLRGVGYADGVAASWEPRTDVVLDPAIQFGDPCVAGTRIQTSQLKALAKRGESARSLAQVYELPVGAVRSALEFEEELADV